ncbi:expressed protein [Phakopsora pachyrhizi]|uniref:Expressed protein n=1 Tax=Phakopsora pachyrhizi TaxID=170000 RepID=A0AAV0AP39_PHAPC|nr:expressed protein [Phakopsora pachyrhizi]
MKTEVDFQKDTTVSPIRFAIKSFTIKGNNSDLKVFTRLQAVYNAMNAAIRSVGSSHDITLKLLKGPDFFIAMLLAIVKKDLNGPEGAQHKLGKVLKNCVRCSERDIADVKAIAAKHRVKPAPETPSKAQPKGHLNSNTGAKP